MREQIAYRPIPARTSAPPASRTYADHSAGIHPEEDEEEYPTRPATSAVRWTTTNGNQVIQSGNRRVVIHKEAPPKRRSHWMLFFGIVLFVMVLGWMAISALGAWWQTKQEDWKYGNPRTSQIDQFVGHGDSAARPDHFIAVNTGGMIEVIEINVLVPKDDHIYPITTAIDPTTPVSLSFQDVNHDGKIDMLVSIGDSNSYTVVLLNNGTAFTR